MRKSVKWSLGCDWVVAVKREIPQNRNPSEKSGRGRFLTLAVACGLVGIAFWNGARLMGDRGTRDRALKAQQQVSTKFHTERDSMSRKERLGKDPVTAFFERAKRGMTEAEIRGMIEEFEAMGPMPTSGEFTESQEFTIKTNEWRLEALTEALSLSAQQKREIRESLRPVYYSKPLELNSFLSAQHFYFANVYADSWSLCQLTEDQLKLTYKKSLEVKYQARWEADKKSGSMSCHAEHLLIMHDPATGEYVDYPSSSSITSSGLNIASGSFMPGTLAGGIIDVTNTFPLTPDQKLADHRDDLVAQAKLLHPSQLRMALLMNTGVALMLKHQLDHPIK